MTSLNFQESCKTQAGNHNNKNEFTEKNLMIMHDCKSCILILFSVISVAVAFGQKANKKESAGNNTFVTIQFEDTLKYKNVRLRILDYSKHDDINELPSYETNLIGGQCSFELSLLNPSFVRIDGVLLNFIAFNTFSKFFFTDGILVEPGDSIFVEVNNPNVTTSFIYPVLKFSGRGSEKMNSQQEIFQRTNKFQFPKDYQNIFNTRLADSTTEMITSILGKYPLSQKVRSIILATLVSMFIPDISEVFIEKIKIDSTSLSHQKTKKLYQAELNQVLHLADPKNPALKFARYMPFFRKRALLEYALANKKKYSQELTYKNYVALENHFPKGALKERELAVFARQAIENAISSGEMLSNKDVIPVIQAYLKSENKESPYYETIHDKFHLLNNGLVKGMPAYPFALPDTTGKIFKLDEYRGKVVLMDFMFNNCLPCHQIVPYLKVLSEKYTSDKVVFVTVCADKDIIQWKKAIATDEWPAAVQVNTEGKGFDHKIIKYYSIHEYPTLILIDKYGKLISARAPDPRIDKGDALNRLISFALAQ